MPVDHICGEADRYAQRQKLNRSLYELHGNAAMLKNVSPSCNTKRPASIAAILQPSIGVGDHHPAKEEGIVLGKVFRLTMQLLWHPVASLEGGFVRDAGRTVSACILFMPTNTGRQRNLMD